MLGGLCPWKTVTREGRPPPRSSAASLRPTSLWWHPHPTRQPITLQGVSSDRPPLRLRLSALALVACQGLHRMPERKAFCVGMPAPRFAPAIDARPWCLAVRRDIARRRVKRALQALQPSRLFSSSVALPALTRPRQSYHSSTSEIMPTRPSWAAASFLLCATRSAKSTSCGSKS